MKSPLQRLYQTKLALLATVSTVAGVALMVLARWASTQMTLNWLHNLPINDVGSALLTTGLIVILFEYVDAQDAEERATQRLRKVLADSKGELRDAVVEGFAFTPDSLTNVASPATLDRVVENCLGLQLGDRTLAKDVYADLREQVVRAQERCQDVQVSVVLSRWDGGSAAGEGAMFVATVKWEYRVVPASPVMRFSCASDPDEYRELLQDPSSNGVWYFEPVAGLDGASPEAYELVQFVVDGRSRPIRRSQRAGTQTFTVNLGQEVVSDGREVTIFYTYRVLIQQRSHLLHLGVAKPSKGFKVQLQYGDCGIRYVNVLDFIASAQQARMVRSPASLPTPAVEVGFDGWVLPGSGVAFVWVLEDERGQQTPIREVDDRVEA
jgi:hypothetical protein